MYKYKHINGKIIEKPDVVVQNPSEYFDSDFVVYWWHIDDETNYTDRISGIGIEFDKDVLQ